VNKTLLILRHEFGHTVKRRGFIVMTLIVPLIALLLIGVFQFISGIAGPTVEAMTIGYVDELGGFQQYTSQGNITLVRFDTANDATDALVRGGINEYFVIPFVFGILLALSIIISSTYLLQGLGEEKENRLIEILLSSVSARQLLTGKVLGIGAAGLVQVAVWVIAAPLLLNLASSSIGGFISTIQLPANFIALAVVYFILGYSLFAVISASVGAVSSGSREGQQLIGLFTLPLLIPLWFTSLMMFFPDNPAWVFFAIFPLSAPVEVIMRLGVSDIPAWQLVASIAVLVLSIIGILLLTIRIFRTYLLMYGKRPGIGEVLRSLRSG